MKSKQSTKKLRRAAFTLIEISVVLLLMAILAAVAVPRWTEAIDGFRATSAARRLVADLSLAQTSALTASRSQTVSFSMSGHSYELVNVRSLDRAASSYRVFLDQDPYRSRIVGLFGSRTDQQVIFNGFGIPNLGGPIEIACGSKQRTVVLNIDTGLAQLQE